MTERCPYHAIAGEMAFSACIAAGEWLMTLTLIDCDDEDHVAEVDGDMCGAAILFAKALAIADLIARTPADTRLRAAVEELRQEIVETLGPDGIDAFFEPDAAARVRQPLDLAPDAQPGEVSQ